MELVRLESWHFDKIEMQEKDIYLKKILTDEIKENLINQHSYSIIDNGVILLCGGAIDRGNRGLVWAFLAKNIKNKMFSVHKIVQKSLRECRINPLQAEINIKYYNNKRWAEMLDFHKENEKIRFPNGDIAEIYLRNK